MTVAEMNRKLALVGSENRGGVLVECLQASSIPSARKLLREWFNSCEAIAPYAADLRTQFERVGYVTDNDEKLEFPLTVYRAAYADDDIDFALSWTTRRETAEFFARHHTSMRARFLGLYRDDVDMLIWQGTCLSALGYLTGRNEFEVIPDEIEEIYVIAELVAVT